MNLKLGHVRELESSLIKEQALLTKERKDLFKQRLRLKREAIAKKAVEVIAV